ncbi:hypothetical protein JAF83_004827 [Citrobacter werkmanii]|nr:hypothetical protein [Citrobacter werkmanii]
MTARKAIGIGITIIIISSLFLWLSSLFHSYVYNRMHIDRNGLLTCLWLLNSFSSYLLYFYGVRQRLLISILYVLFLGGLMTLMHFIFWNDTYNDFSGIEGLKVISGVYFIISAITICIGAGVGFITSCLKRR